MVTAALLPFIDSRNGTKYFLVFFTEQYNFYNGREEERQLDDDK